MTPTQAALRTNMATCPARHRGAWLRGLLFISLLCLAHPATAADVPLGFDDAQQQARFDALLEELRCLVCQNQSLADSHADLAQDLRNEVHRMVAAGADRAAIIDFMVARYGDFVLYRPPLKATTWLLWTAPALLLLLAVVIVLRVARARATSPLPALDEAERERLRALQAAAADDDSAARP